MSWAQAADFQEVGPLRLLVTYLEPWAGVSSSRDFELAIAAPAGRWSRHESSPDCPVYSTSAADFGLCWLGGSRPWNRTVGDDDCADAGRTTLGSADRGADGIGTPGQLSPERPAKQTEDQGSGLQSGRKRKGNKRRKLFSEFSEQNGPNKTGRITPRSSDQIFAAVQIPGQVAHGAVGFGHHQGLVPVVGG